MSELINAVILIHVRAIVGTALKTQDVHATRFESGAILEAEYLFISISRIAGISRRISCIFFA